MNLCLSFLLVRLAGWINRHQQRVLDYLRAENRVLREHVKGRRVCWTEAQRRCLAEKANEVGRAGLLLLGTIVTPETLLRWYRSLVAKKFDASKTRKPGRPPVKTSIAMLVLGMARSNSTWGYTRIRGALHNLGHEVARNTVKKILADHHVEPAPERSRRTSWKTFLASHLGAISAADFFSVEAVSAFGLIRYHVFFVLDLATRRVHIASITRDPNEAWMKQMARNLTDAVSGFLNGTRYLIVDRDPLYTKAFRRMLKDAGTQALRLPARSPNLNAFAERFVRSIRSEYLDRVIPLGEKHLRVLVSEYVEHYHTEGNHQGLSNRLLQPLSANTNAGDGPVKSRRRLGGLLSYYYREAA